MFKRIMQNINHSYYSTPSITFDEKINRLELVLHHPLVAGAKEKRRIQTGLTLFTIKDRALNSMQVAIQAEIDKLTAAQTIKNEK